MNEAYWEAHGLKMSGLTTTLLPVREDNEIEVNKPLVRTVRSLHSVKIWGLI